MSAESTPLDTGLLRYLAERTLPEDAFLGDLKVAAVEAGIPAIQISPEQASFMQILLKLSKAREVVEVGTLAGYSAVAMARALPADGRVRSIELMDAHADFAEEWIAKSDVAGRVEIHRGKGSEVLKGFADDSADACFIDADKPGYRDYLEQCLRIVRKGGLLMCDNAFAFGQLLDPSCQDESVLAMRAFNDWVAAEDRLHGIIAPVGDGCWVAIRK